GRYLTKTENIVDHMIDEIARVEDRIPDKINDHAIIIGHGRTGRIIGNQLYKQAIPSIVIDSSLTTVEELIKNDYLTIWGDATEQAILEKAHINTAKWLILSMPNSYKAAEIVSLARKLRPDIAIYVRAFYE